VLAGVLGSRGLWPQRSSFKELLMGLPSAAQGYAVLGQAEV
jgi:hypothetical protein